MSHLFLYDINIYIKSGDFFFDFYDDIYGPFGTLATAQKHFKKYITNRSIDEKHLYSIRGTEYKTDRGFNTIWYATGEEVNYETIN